MVIMYIDFIDANAISVSWVSGFYFLHLFAKIIVVVSKVNFLKGLCHHVEGFCFVVKVKTNEGRIKRMNESRKPIIVVGKDNNVSRKTIMVKGKRYNESKKGFAVSLLSFNVRRNCHFVR